MQKIEIKDALELKDAIFVDTRSPGEFEIDHIPNSVNVAIFDNMERAEIGTLYKQNKDKAFEKGFMIYSKKIPELKKLLQNLDKTKKIVVYCWRGGLRSKTMTELIERLGYNAIQLEGGYKQYRAKIREWYNNLKLPFKFIMLQGLAGCGKTDILKELEKKGYGIIDLEGAAKHRSSVFGAIGLKPREQKAFETELYIKINELIKQNKKYVFIEGEAHKVGKVFIPNKIFNAMQNAIKVKVDCSIENRSNRIVRDYFTHDEDEKIKEIINSFKQNLSKKRVEELCILLDEKNYFEVSKILLEEYYDSRYIIIVEQFKYDFDVNSDDVNDCCEKLMEIYENLTS